MPISKKKNKTNFGTHDNAVPSKKNARFADGCKNMYL